MPYTYKGYSLNNEGDTPWEAREHKLFEDMIDRLPPDGSRLITSEHYHSTLVNPSNNASVLSISGTTISIPDSSGGSLLGLNGSKEVVEYALSASGVANNADNFRIPVSQGVGTDFTNSNLISDTTSVQVRSSAKMIYCNPTTNMDSSEATSYFGSSAPLGTYATMAPISSSSGGMKIVAGKSHANPTMALDINAHTGENPSTASIVMTGSKCLDSSTSTSTVAISDNSKILKIKNHTDPQHVDILGSGSIALSNDSSSHTMTNYLPATSYGKVGPVDTTDFGLQIVGATHGANKNAVKIYGISEALGSADSTFVKIVVGQSDTGGGITSPNTNSIALQVLNTSSELIRLQCNGDMYVSRNLNVVGQGYVEGTKRIACGGGVTGMPSAASYSVTLEIEGVSHTLLAM
jgi:hypothetical protein